VVFVDGARMAETLQRKRTTVQKVSLISVAARWERVQLEAIVMQSR